MTQMIDISKIETLPTTFRDSVFQTAKLSEFRAATPSVLFGQRLKDIKKLESSIAAHGLMRPLKVMLAGNKLIVIDGRKRLAALRRMRFKNTLPRSLVNIPFVLSAQAVPHLHSAQEQFRSMTRLAAKGAIEASIADTLCVSAKQLHMLQSIERLSPRLKKAFLNDTLSLEQAWAFSALPWHEAQDSLLLSIGPCASPHEITDAITRKMALPDPKPAPKPTRRTAPKTDIIALASPPINGLAGDKFGLHALQAA